MIITLKVTRETAREEKELTINEIAVMLITVRARVTPNKIESVLLKIFVTNHVGEIQNDTKMPTVDICGDMSRRIRIPRTSPLTFQMLHMLNVATPKMKAAQHRAAHGPSFLIQI